MALCDSFGHADGTGRTDKAAEVTADALGAYQTGAAGLMIEDDGLMTAVATRNLAAATADTQLLVELRVDDRIAIQMVGLQEFRQLLANKFLQLADTTLSHIALQAEDKVVDEAIAVLHDGGTHLHIAAAQLDELQGITPRLDAADTAEFNL